MSFVWLQQQLGKTDAKKVSENKTLYKWRCEDHGNYLIAIVNDNGRLLKLKGQYNSDDGSGFFTTNIPKSAMSDDLTQPQLQTTPAPLTSIPAASTSGRIHQYNEHYKTNSDFCKT